MGCHFISLELYKLVSWYHGLTLLNNSSYTQRKKLFESEYQEDIHICICKNKKRLGEESAIAGKAKMQEDFHNLGNLPSNTHSQAVF